MNSMAVNVISLETICPYCDAGTDICNASCSSLVIDERMRTKYCENEDYDDCPIFMAKKLLRR